MRTTLTLDPDVAARLERLRRRKDARLKDVVNDALRAGLKAMEVKPKQTRPKSWTKPIAMGPSKIGSLDNIAEVLALIEGEDFK